MASKNGLTQQQYAEIAKALHRAIEDPGDYGATAFKGVMDDLVDDIAGVLAHNPKFDRKAFCGKLMSV